jgi:hypothetical protein
VLPVGGESAGVDPVSVENPGGAADGKKKGTMGRKSTGDKLPAHLLSTVADLDARGIAPQVVAVAVLADRADPADPRPTRMVCRWPANTASGWSAWEADEYLSACPNPRMRHYAGYLACGLDNARQGQ